MSACTRPNRSARGRTPRARLADGRVEPAEQVELLAAHAQPVLPPSPVAEEPSVVVVPGEAPERRGPRPPPRMVVHPRGDGAERAEAASSCTSSSGISPVSHSKRTTLRSPSSGVGAASRGCRPRRPPWAVSTTSSLRSASIQSSPTRSPPRCGPVDPQRTRLPSGSSIRYVQFSETFRSRTVDPTRGRSGRAQSSPAGRWPPDQCSRLHRLEDPRSRPRALDALVGPLR